MDSTDGMNGIDAMNAGSAAIAGDMMTYGHSNFSEGNSPEDFVLSSSTSSAPVGLEAGDGDDSDYPTGRAPSNNSANGSSAAMKSLSRSKSSFSSFSNASSLRSATSSAKPAVTPLPWAYISIVFIMFTTDTLALTSLTPYLPFLVESFGIVKERWMLGYIAGFIASSYYAAQFFSSFIWGNLSDRYGRRPIMLIGITATFFSTLAFGLSRNLPFALACRLFYGAFNGNLGVMKTFLAEMTDKTNQGKAFSYIGLTFGIGQIVGPIIGGYLAQPVENFPGLFNASSPLRIFKPFLEFFPFFLPNLTIAIFVGFAGVVGFFFLKESNRAILKKRRSMSRVNSEIELMDKSELDTTHHDDIMHLEERDIDVSVSDSTNQLDEDIVREDTLKTQPSEDRLVNNNSKLKRVVSSVSSLSAKVTEPIPKKLSLRERLKSSEVFSSSTPLLTVLIYTGLGINSVLFAEILPLWAILSPKRWGISFSSNDLGLLFTLSGAMIFFFNWFIIHRLIDIFGLMGNLRIGSILGLPFLVFFPAVSFFFFPTPSMFLVWSSLLFLNLIRQITSQMQFTSIMIMINNSVSYKSMGFLNGISQSAVAASRAVGPSLGGVLFAMSIYINTFPFDVHLVFIIMTLINLWCLILSYLLPKSISSPKEVDDDDDNDNNQAHMQLMME